MRTSFGKVLVGYEVRASSDVNAQLLEDVCRGLDGMVALTPPRIQGGIWRMAVYYAKHVRDDPPQLRNQFQRQLEDKLDRVVNVRWFNVGPSSTPGGLTPA